MVTFAAVLAACGGGDPDEDVPLATVEIENTSTQEVSFNLSINGRAFFTSENEILQEINPRRDGANDFEVAVALWRFVIANRYHSEPYSARSWAHAPSLFFNSLGFGLCDDSASALRALATRAGLEARVWFLNGHLVAEILVEGRWAMFDPDFEVYYLNRDGTVASVEQLEADPSLITSPAQPVVETSPLLLEAIDGLIPGLTAGGAPAHSQYLADLYASRQDNWVEPWYHEYEDPAFAPTPFLLPPGARLIIDASTTVAATSYDGQPVRRSAAIQLELAEGWSGTLRFPLVVAGASGTGLVRIDGDTMNLASPEFAAFLSSRETAVTTLEVVRSSAADRITLLVNPLRYRLEDLRRVAVAGVPEGALRVTRRPAAAPNGSPG